MLSYPNWEKFYYRLNLIFHGIVASTLIPFSWVFLETQKEFPGGPVVSELFILPVEVVLVTLSVVLLVLAIIISRQGMKRVWLKEAVKEKLDVYLVEKIKHYALLEGTALLGLVGLFLTKEHLFTVVYLIVLFVFSLQRPSFDRVAKEIRVKGSDLKSWADGED